MSEEKPAPGTVIWRDLTVPNAETVADFYREVVGWEIEPTSMGEYEDYSLKVAGTDEVVAGVCHARGTNAGIPPQWLVYITVADVDESAKKCVAAGGKILEGPRECGEGRACIIEDPAGAVAALYCD